MKKLSIVIPAYNEQAFIAQTLQRVIDADSVGLTKEIIIVDDASRDKTVEVVRAYVKKKYKKILKGEKLYTSPKVQLLLYRKTKNEGKGSAMKAGFAKSTGDIVIVQDADLEYDPNEYSLMLEPFFSFNADVVYGSRFISNRPHRVLYFWHYVANVVITILSNMFTNLNLSDIETGFKAFRGDIIRKVTPYLKAKQFGFEPEITARMSQIKEIKIYEVGISYFGRTYAEGKKIGLVDGFRAIWEVFYFNSIGRMRFDSKGNVIS